MPHASWRGRVRRPGRGAAQGASPQTRPRPRPRPSLVSSRRRSRHVTREARSVRADALPPPPPRARARCRRGASPPRGDLRGPAGSRLRGTPLRDPGPARRSRGLVPAALASPTPGDRGGPAAGHRLARIELGGNSGPDAGARVPRVRMSPRLAAGTRSPAVAPGVSGDRRGGRGWTQSPSGSPSAGGFHPITPVNASPTPDPVSGRDPGQAPRRSPEQRRAAQPPSPRPRLTQFDFSLLDEGSFQHGRNICSIVLTFRACACVCGPSCQEKVPRYKDTGLFPDEGYGLVRQLS